MHVELIVYTLPIAGKQVFVEMSIAVRDVGHAQSMIARSIVTDALHILVKKTEKAPFICDSCSEKNKKACKYNKYYYIAEKAEAKAKDTFAVARRSTVDTGRIADTG